MHQLTIDEYRMSRMNDHETSKDAAKAVSRTIGKLHQIILYVLKRHPHGFTDEQLESERDLNLAGYGPSTIRKRRSELYQMGLLEQAGTTTNSRGRKMIVWRLAK